MKKDESRRIVSNLNLSKECFIELKVISVRKQITIQEVITDILERAMSKKNKSHEVNEENI